MENQKNRVELSRLCRTCTAERLHMSPIFARESDISCGLDNMLMSCTNLKILETDGFPSLICDQCVDQLKSAYRFQQRCETADRYYKQLGLKSNTDCTQTTMVFNKGPNYDYIEMPENNLIVFRCRECCQAFSTIRELKNHKLVHSKNEIIEEKHESLSVTKFVDFTEEENEEEHLLEMNQEEEIGGGGDQDSNSSFFKKFNSCKAEENSEMDAIPMKSEIKEEDLSTFLDTVIKEEEQDNGKDECNMSNLFFDQSYQSDTKKLEVVAIQKEIEKESLLEVLKETDARPDNVKSSSGDNQDEDYSPSADSDLDYFPEQKHRINIRTKDQNHRNARRQHQLTKKLNSPKSRNLRIHKSRHNASKPIKCDVCEKTFSSSSHLNTHKWVHNPNKRFKCDVCEKQFTYSHNLRSHKFMHNAEKPFKCDVCEKSFPSSSHLRTHKWLHNPNKRFKCDVCEKQFTYSHYLRDHKLTHNADKPFKCDICEKLFTHSTKLSRHQLTHNAYKPFKCDVCNKTFVSNGFLNRHKLTHNLNKPFKCDMCEKSFSCKWHLRNHMWTHNPNKRFKCDVCEKSFTYNCSLKAHKLTHNADKPFKCDVCEESFSCNSTFREHEQSQSHQLIYNAYKPFKCDVCEKSFTCNWNLKQHKWTHDPNKRFKCDVCDKSYARNSVLKKHKLMHNTNTHTVFLLDTVMLGTKMEIQ